MQAHKPPFLLSEIKLEVTHECDLVCQHCSSIAKAKSELKMKWNDCKRILTEAAEMGAKEVVFSGGEPLLWEPLNQAVSYAYDLGMSVSLYTTGNVPEALLKIERLKRSGLSRIMFSLFGKDENKHEKTTQVMGSFETTLSIARNCVLLPLNVEFHFVPMVDNYKELRPIADLGKTLGVKRISVLRLVPQGRGSRVKQKQLDHNQNITLRKTILELREEGYDIRTGSPYNALMLRDRPHCCSGIDRLTVSPELKIFPCDAFKQITPEALGVSRDYSSLHDDSISDCWQHSPYLAKVREYLMTPFAAECDVCTVLEKCLSGCMAQKFHKHGQLVKSPDPMCLMATTQ